MNALTKVGVWGSAGIAIFVLVTWFLTAQTLAQAAGNSLIPLGFFVSAGAYGALRKRTPIAGALALTIPLLVAAVALKQLLLAPDDGFSWSYTLILGGAAGAMWGFILPFAARFRDKKSRVA